MTTVAYNHKDKQICVDGMLVVNDTVVCDDYEKFIVDGDLIFFLCGNVSDYKRLVNAYNGAIEHDVNCAAIMVKDGTTYHCCVNSSGKIEVVELCYSSAIGRGDEVALVAMDFGATAKQAVEHAAKRTTSTGGKLRLYDIVKGEFI